MAEAVPKTLCLADSGLVAQAAALATQSMGAAPTLLRSLRQLRQEPGLALRLPFRRFDAALVYLADVRAPLYRDFILAYLWLLRAPFKALRDVRGGELRVDARTGLAATLRCARDVLALPVVYGRAEWRACRLSRGSGPRGTGAPGHRHVAYLRANLWQESHAGGSVAHTAGVLSGLRAAGLEVTYLATAPFAPAAALGLQCRVVPPTLSRVQNLPDLSFVAYGAAFTRQALDLFGARAPAFVYQRYSVFNSSGAELARRLRRPLVLEYNGSEVWIARHWSSGLLFEGLARRIEQANLRAADLVVVVSEALREELQRRGVPDDRILVNPNGVDPARYHPEVDGTEVRRRLNLNGRFVTGFVGTFGPWHGADVLAHAVRRVTEHVPEAHFLFVGDGSGLPRVREIVAQEGSGAAVTFTGLVPQEEGPAYLAACDLLASPHVPNPDGTPFFGSPTKLFEYMAMGRAIVASDLGQIGEVLAHGQTAWLTKPGDAEDLARGIVALAADPALQRRLAAAARTHLVAHYTWDEHVRRLLDRMVKRRLISASTLLEAGGA